MRKNLLPTASGAPTSTCRAEAPRLRGTAPAPRSVATVPGPAVPDRIQSIPTLYGGIEFRSRLEANVASLFDACGVSWVYEQESCELPGVGRYLPDFWLPDARQVVEVKGALSDPSIDKPVALARALRRGAPDEEEAARPAAVVVLSQPFIRWHLGAANEAFGVGWNGVQQVDALLVTCPLCRDPVFMSVEEGWTCPACGRYMGREWQRVLVRATHRRGRTSYSLIEPLFGAP